MQEVMKHFVHLEKNSSEFGEKVAKATDDLGKNLTKAGDKLLAVWDLNDLKDDTIEMKDHVQAVDIVHRILVGQLAAVDQSHLETNLSHSS